MSPFNNHWSSSLLLSFDPVAIESVALDILRTEFSRPEHTIAHISSYGVDDYLHQAADSGNWPKILFICLTVTVSRWQKALEFMSTGIIQTINNIPVETWVQETEVELVKVFQKGFAF